MSNPQAISKTILELEKEGRYAESGYGKLFAYQSLHFNAMIDARTKAKRLREHNPWTWEDTQKNVLYSGPTVFLDKKKDLTDKFITKADIISAYAAYLVNSTIKKPGVYRRLHQGAVPLSERLALYVLRFRVSINSPFVHWFLNSSAIQTKKIKSGGGYVWGDISIFASKEMNMFKYISKWLKAEDATIIKSYTFYGKETINVNVSQIMKLFTLKEAGMSSAKAELVQSTGWLSHVDRTTYYHMIQYVKYWLLMITDKYGLWDHLIGVQTDCIFYINDKETRFVEAEIQADALSLANNESMLGRLKFETVASSEIMTYNRRVVKKND